MVVIEDVLVGGKPIGTESIRLICSFSVRCGAVRVCSVRSVLVRCADTRAIAKRVVAELCRSGRCDRSNSIDWLLSVAADFVAMDFVVAGVSIGCVEVAGQQC